MMACVCARDRGQRTSRRIESEHPYRATAHRGASSKTRAFAGNRANSVYLPRFRNLAVNTANSTLARGYGHRARRCRIAWSSHLESRAGKLTVRPVQLTEQALDVSHSPEIFALLATLELAAFSISAATACGCDTYTAWLPGVRATVEPARFDMSSCAAGGIILSSVAIRYQLGLFLHAASVTAPLSASRPHGTCESARIQILRDQARKLRCTRVRPPSGHCRPA